MMVRAGLSLLAIAAAVVVAALAPAWWREQRLMRDAEPIRASLESYRSQHGRYPDALSRIGMAEKEEGPIYYSRESESSYILWFGRSLGESRTFHSTDQKWH